MSISERCDWIQDVLLANNFGNDYQYHPPASWLEFYKISLSQYQRHVPDNRKKQWSKKVKPPSNKFSSDSDAEDEDSDVGHISFAKEGVQETSQVHWEAVQIPVKTMQGQTTDGSNILPADQQSIEQILTKNSPVLQPEAVLPSTLMTPKLEEAVSQQSSSLLPLDLLESPEEMKTGLAMNQIAGLSSMTELLPAAPLQKPKMDSGQKVESDELDRMHK